MNLKTKKRIPDLLLGILLVRLILTLCWFYGKADGFFVLFGDSCSRTLAGYKWAQLGLIHGFPHGHTWLPLQFFMLASIFKFVPDTINVPPLLSLFFFLGTVIWIYRISKNIFSSVHNEAIAILSCSIVCFYPWFFHSYHPNWFLGLSLSGMADPIFHFFILGAISFLLDYLKHRTRQRMILCSILLTLAAATRYEAWSFVIIISILLFADLVKHTNNQKSVYFNIFCILLPYTVISFWFYDQYRSNEGNALYFLHWTMQFANKDLDLLKKIAFYPLLFIKIDPIISSTAVAGMLLSFKNKIDLKQTTVFLLIGFFYLLALTAVSTIWGPVGFISRPMTVFFLIAIPFTSYLIIKLLNVFLSLENLRLFTALLVCFLIINYIFSLNSQERFGFGKNESIAAGRIINKQYSSGNIEANKSILFELSQETGFTWDYWIIKIFSPNTLILDRNDTIDQQGQLIIDNNPSVLEMKLPELIQYCRKQQISLITLTSDTYIEKLKPFTEHLWKNSKYTILKINDHPDRNG